MSDSTIQLPPNSGGPILDCETFTNSASVSTNRERIATCPGIPNVGQTTIANVAGSASGNTSIVASGGGSTTIRVMRLLLSVASPTNIQLMNGASLAMGPYYLQGGGSITLDDTGEPWMVCSAATAFQINSSNTVNYTCTVWYTLS